MKKLLTAIFASSSLLILCGCESMGFNPRGVDEALTPGIDADTTVRTWSTSADGNPVPSEKEVANPPAFQ